MPRPIINGYRLYYAIDDLTDPWLPHQAVLMQHGFLRRHVWFYGWLPTIVRYLRVFRPDLRGHGNSQAPSLRYDWSFKGFAD